MSELWELLRSTRSLPVVGDTAVIYVLFTSYPSMFIALVLSYIVGSFLAEMTMARILLAKSSTLTGKSNK